MAQTLPLTQLCFLSLICLLVFFSVIVGDTSAFLVKDIHLMASNSAADRPFCGKPTCVRKFLRPERKKGKVPLIFSVPCGKWFSIYLCGPSSIQLARRSNAENTVHVPQVLLSGDVQHHKLPLSVGICRVNPRAIFPHSTTEVDTSAGHHPLELT